MYAHNTHIHIQKKKVWPKVAVLITLHTHTRTRMSEVSLKKGPSILANGLICCFHGLSPSYSAFSLTIAISSMVAASTSHPGNLLFQVQAALSCFLAAASEFTGGRDLTPVLQK